MQTSKTPLGDKISHMSNRERFSEWLQSEMGKRNWTQADLSRQSGLHRAIISKLVLASSTPLPDTLLAIASAFKLPESQVFEAAGILPSNKDVDPWVEQMNVLLNSIKDPRARAIAEKLLDSLASNEEEAAATQIQPKKAKGHA